MAQKRATHLPPGMCLSVTMRDSHSVRDLKQMYGKTRTHPGTSLDELVITYSGRVFGEQRPFDHQVWGAPWRVPLGFSATVSLSGVTAGKQLSQVT